MRTSNNTYGCRRFFSLIDSRLSVLSEFVTELLRLVFAQTPISCFVVSILKSGIVQGEAAARGLEALAGGRVHHRLDAAGRDVPAAPPPAPAVVVAAAGYEPGHPPHQRGQSADPPHLGGRQRLIRGPPLQQCSVALRRHLVLLVLRRPPLSAR